MINRFMISVAALALIAGTGFANAQGMGKESGGASGGGAMQHSAPGGNSAGSSRPDSSAGASEATDSSKSESAKSESKDSSKSGTKSSQSEKQPGGMKNDRAEDNNVKGGSTSQRAEDRAKGSNDAAKSGSMKAEDRDHNGRDNNMKAEGRQDKSGTNAAESKSSTTTGQAGAGAKLTSDQRTQISTAFRSEHVQSVNNVNFSVSVGTRVPREGVHFYPVPERVVTIYPEWRGYEYIVVHDRIVIIDPHTYEIVDIIES